MPQSDRRYSALAEQTGFSPLGHANSRPIAKMPSSIKQRKEHHSNKQQPTSSKPINNSPDRRIV
jgi:hypothetical protein